MCRSKSFLRCSRNYNNDLALASFITKLMNIPGKYPQVLRIRGQIYHNVASVHTITERETRNYGYLYFIESNSANVQRLQKKLK